MAETLPGPCGDAVSAGGARVRGGGVVAGCSVGPDYVTPSVPLTPAYKEKSPETIGSETSENAGQWKVAQPGDQTIRSKWWETFGDPQLDALEDDVTAANQTLKAAEA